MSELPIVVSDATPLIALSKIGQLHNIPKLFGHIFVPRAVYEEVINAGKERSRAKEIAEAEWIIVREVKDQSRVDYLLTQLDIGEAEAIVLAQEIRAGIVLVDERKARAVAQRLGLDVVGTAGILLLLKQQKLVTSIRPLLDQLRTSNFRLSDRIYEYVISQANE